MTVLFDMVDQQAAVPSGSWVPSWVLAYLEATRGPVVADSTDLLIKRCDQGWEDHWPHGARSLKAKACLRLATSTRWQPIELVTACSVGSPQSEIVATVASELKIRASIFIAQIPVEKYTTHLRNAVLNATIRGVRPGYTSVLENRALTYVDLNQKRVLIPFGMIHPASVAQAQYEMTNIPSGVGTIVVPTGSGITLTGVARAVGQRQPVPVVIGVAVGRDPRSVINAYGGSHAAQITVIDPVIDYHVEVETDTPYDLHPIYEGKAWRWMIKNWSKLKKPVCFVIIGSRAK